VLLDRSESSVKDIVVLAVPEHRLVYQRLRTKALEISRVIASRWKTVQPTRERPFEIYFSAKGRRTRLRLALAQFGPS